MASYNANNTILSSTKNKEDLSGGSPELKFKPEINKKSKALDQKVSNDSYVNKVVT